jgi:paraquat-inducible protein B
MTDIYLPQPKIAQKHGIAPIWLLPIVALLVGVWLVYRSLLEVGPQITVDFENGEGIVPNQTQVKYKGIVIGVVKQMKAKEDFSGVTADIEMDQRVGDTLGGVPADAQFWLVQPQVGIGGVSGLGALFSGNYIGISMPKQIQPSQDGKIDVPFAEHFVALKSAPGLPDYVPGLHIQFKTDRLGSVSVGTPVFLRQIQIGSVDTAAMVSDGSGVLIGVFIQPKYEHLVHKNSRFWNTSGLRVEAGLSGVKIETDSMASLLAGGISMSAPYGASPASEDGDAFYLYEDFEAAEASVFVNVEFHTAEGLTKGVTKVMYKNMTVGKLRDVWYNSQKDVVYGRFGIDPRFESFITDKTRFWLVRPQLSASGISGLDALVSGSYLAFAASDEGEPVRDHNFVAADGPDPLDYREAGLHLHLKATTASVPAGTPVYYKDFVVGSVQSQLLEGEGAGIHILVKSEYRHLVNVSSRFWNVGGIHINASLTGGLQVESGPLMALVAGGIAFDTPDSKANKDVHDGQQYTLFASEKVAKAPAKGSAAGLYLTLESPDATGVTTGAPVLYHDLPVGEVQEVKHGVEGRNVEVRIYIEQQYARYLRPGSRFWRASGIEVTAGSNGLSVKTGSLNNVLLGGIAFDQFGSENAAVAEPLSVKKEDRYRLYAGREDAANAGLLVRLTLRSAQGLAIGSAVNYRGMVLGEITRLQFSDDMKTVLAELSLKQEARNLVTSGSRFWKVVPALGLARTSNLDTLIGSYLALMPGEGEPQRDFILSEQEPVQTSLETGLNLTLHAAQLGSLKAGDPVLFHQVKVGEVLGSDLASDGKHVEIYINVWPQYSTYVNSKSHFWNVSGVRVKAGLFSGVKVDTESLESVLAGGVAFDSDQNSEAATQGQLFNLDDKK